MKLARRIIALSFFIHLPAAWVVLTLVEAPIIARALGAPLISLAWAALLRGRLRLAFDDRPVSAIRALAERLFYALWGASLAVSVVSVVALPASLVLPDGAARGALAAVVATGIACGLYAVFVRARVVRVAHRTLVVDGLPPAFDGVRIAHLSDVHIGSLYRAETFARVVAMTNRQAVDLVALTGDYVTTGTRFHVEAARALGALRSRLGTVAVLGNHDNFGGREPLLSELRAQGVVVLRNEAHAVRREGAPDDEEPLRLVGVDDVFTRSDDVDAALAASAGPPHIALVHDPRVFPKLARRGVPITLAGHTHWGQVGVPFFARRLNLGAPVFKRFNTGAEEGGATLVVHPGIGTTGPPMRLGVPPTISVLELRRQAP